VEYKTSGFVQLW